MYEMCLHSVAGVRVRHSSLWGQMLPGRIGCGGSLQCHTTAGLEYLGDSPLFPILFFYGQSVGAKRSLREGSMV